MNDSDDGPNGPDPGARTGPGAREPVGSVGDEAAKLLGALSEWARDQGTDYAGSASGAAGSFVNAVRDVSEHIATGSEDCRYCPVCHVIHAVRQTSPEVKAHLTLAASSLAHAVAGLLATHTTGQPRSSSVEKIDLDSGADWEEDQ
ncbi:MAG: hypothetical protein ABIR34_06410 [Marmoricola sp.]